MPATTWTSVRKQGAPELTWLEHNHPDIAHEYEEKIACAYNTPPMSNVEAAIFKVLRFGPNTSQVYILRPVDGLE
jgi:hypothetical protein